MSKKSLSSYRFAENLKSFEEQWRNAANIYNAYITSGDVVPVDVVRNLFAQTEHVLWNYLRPDNWRAGLPQKHLPPEVAEAIARQIRYIVNGKCPDPISDLTGRGRGGSGTRETEDIGYAVAYLELVERGEITDPAPTQHIARLYRVPDALSAERGPYSL
jgi:hypothetical protein